VRRVFRILFRLFEFGVIVLVLLVVVYGVVRYNDDEPVTYDDIEAHFKHGSTGGERGWMGQFGFGIPYWIWIALPEQFADYLPDGKAGQGYASFGMIYEDGTNPRYDLPIGMSMRRTMGIDRVYFNCALCHTGSVRDAPGGPRRAVLGMPANTFDLGALIVFLEQAGQDYRFQGNRMVPEIDRLADEREKVLAAGKSYRPKRFGFLDHAVFKLIGVSVMRDQLLNLVGQLAYMDFKSWGPGRVDTFNSPKALLGFRMDTAPERERTGNADFPSVWNQKARKGMWLHWDGNNCSVDERNLSAGFGTGATPATIDRDKVLRTADWLWDKAQPIPFPSEHIDRALAAHGEPIYQQYCWDCHGAAKAPFRQVGDGSKVGEITQITDIGTDRWRLDSYTPELAQAQGSIYAGYPLAGDEACKAYFENVCKPSEGDDSEYRALRDKCYPSRFMHFRKTNGYANMPLDGLWLRAPYLHNGSVPNLRELLEPADGRSRHFYTGYDVYDYANVGFVTQGPEAEARGWSYDTTVRGNGNAGHEGPEYGTLLNAEEKSALIEYLKTF